MERLKLYPLKPYTPQQLAEAYEVSSPTIKKWIKPFLLQIGERQGHFYSIKQVEIIFDALGWPEVRQ